MTWHLFRSSKEWHHNKVWSKCNPNGIIVFITIQIDLFKYKRFKSEGCYYKNTGLSHLTSKVPIVVIQKFCYYGNLTSHFSSLLWRAKRAAREHANEWLFLCPPLLANSSRLSSEFSRLPQMERLLAGLTYTCVWFNMLVQLCFIKLLKKKKREVHNLYFVH